MGVIQSLFLGIIQGLTEFLPISSSGHLIFIPKLFGWADQGLAFDTAIHLGTLVAVAIYFRAKLRAIVKSYFNLETKETRKLGNLLLLSVIPAVIVGFFGGDWLEANVRSTGVIAFGMIFWGIVLWIADNIERLKDWKIKGLENLSWSKALFIGCAQAVALIPGVSRSGITITAGLFSKLDKKSAAEFSFLMSVPIIFLAGLSGVFDFAKLGIAENFLPLIIGFIASAASGFIAILGLMRIIQKWSYAPFVVYRIIVGILILVFLL